MAKRVRSLELDGIQHGILRLSSKQDAKLSYSFLRQHDHKSTDPKRVLVFLSGIDNASHIWQKTINKLTECARSKSITRPPMLFYDRLGVGKSDSDPTDAGKEEKDYHDCNESVRDLRELILHVLMQQYELDSSAASKVHLVFCAHSFGACVGRLYNAAYPGTLEGMIILDSAIAALPAENFIPNPDVSHEWDTRDTWAGSKLGFPDETIITKDMCRKAIQIIKASPISGYAMTTRERMRWDNMPQLLPHNDRPKLRGPSPGLPLVTIIVHDPEIAIKEQTRLLRIPEVIMRHAFHPALWAYHSGLPNIQGQGIGKGPVVARGAGHMIHLDRPDLVAAELLELLEASARFADGQRARI